MKVVVATAKVRIFKQITTYRVNTPYFSTLLLLPQRYEFSSKSQHILDSGASLTSCCCYRKGTNFQANHNEFVLELTGTPVVVATAKVRIFKQITTRWLRFVSRLRLLLLPQRYEFSSKSQLVGSESEQVCRCCCYRKGTNFQANHNFLI